MVKVSVKYNNSYSVFDGVFTTDHIYKHLQVTNSFYELALLEKVKSLNLTGTYIDCGANIGNHTVFFSKYCNSTRVISFELDNTIFNVLEHNVDINNLNNVKIFNCGVGEMKKMVSTSSLDNTNVGMTKILQDGGNVQVDALDNLLKDVEDIKLIKIDVEGYEKNVILGGKEILKKHKPTLIVELRDDQEFNEFKTLIEPLGYFTDKVSYAKTPTYFWEHTGNKYEYVYIIPTYERYDIVKKLIDQILNQVNNCLIILNDDGSTDTRYQTFKTYNHRLKYIRNDKNQGKDGFWVTVNSLFTEMEKYEFNYGIMLGDDFELVDDFQNKLKKYINGNDIIRLFTQTSVTTTNWGYNYWVDGAFCAPYEFFKKINFELFPIVRKGRQSSSGVGNQMTERLNNLNFTVKNYGSLIIHKGNNDSKMHPNLRRQQPLVASFDVNEYDMTIIIPTYGNIEYIDECINSILKNSTRINVEILIGIDGCQKTLNHIKDRTYPINVRFYYFEKNVGPYIVKNSLSENSKSKFILFFDSDDIMVNNMVSKIYDDLNKFDCVKPMYINQENNKLINDGSKNWGEGVFAIKKDIFLIFNGFEPWRCAADSEFMNRLYRNHIKVNMTNEVLFHRRLHNNNLTVKQDTNYHSKLRSKYNSLSINKTNFGPLQILHVENYTQVNINHEYSKIIEEQIIEEITNKEKLEIVKNTVNPIIKETPIEMDVDYEAIHSENKRLASPKVQHTIRQQPKEKEGSPKMVGSIFQTNQSIFKNRRR